MYSVMKKNVANIEYETRKPIAVPAVNVRFLKNPRSTIGSAARSWRATNAPSETIATANMPRVRVDVQP